MHQYAWIFRKTGLKTDFFLSVFLDILERFTEGLLDVSMYHSIKQKTMSRAKQLRKKYEIFYKSSYEWFI